MIMAGFCKSPIILVDGLPPKAMAQVGKDAVGGVDEVVSMAEIVAFQQDVGARLKDLELKFAELQVNLLGGKVSLFLCELAFKPINPFKNATIPPPNAHKLRLFGTSFLSFLAAAAVIISIRSTVQ
jgi:hypothetical protein